LDKTSKKGAGIMARRQSNTQNELVIQDSIQQDGTSADRSEAWMVDRRSFLLAGLLGLGGCKSWINRGKGSDAVTAPTLPGDEGVKFVSDLSRVWGASPARITGVGMVSELNGTGSAPAPSKFRDELTAELRTRQINEPNKLLSSDWTSLVILNGIAPAGIRKGQGFDVFVTLEPGSTTSSLEGGYLMPARLTPQQITNSGQVLNGQLAGNVTGPVLTYDLFESEGRTTKINGIVPGGGVMTIDRPFGFQTKEENRSIREAVLLTKSINNRFNYFDNSQRQPVANAKNDIVIELQVPAIYRDNVYRYLHVLRNIVVAETASQQVNRLEALEQLIMDPETAELASIRLEAIGENGTAILERALRSPEEKVRFMAAMALTYQGKNTGCPELGRLAESQWAYRWHAFTALSALPDPVARKELQKLLHVKSVETRYGAVRSLTQRGETDSEMMIENFGKSGENFSLNTIYSTADPIIHVAKFKRTEIAVFNPDQKIKPGMLFVGSGWTIKSRNDQFVEIINYRSEGGDRTVRCSNMATDVIRTLGQMGANYTLLVQWLKQASIEQYLEGRLVINALPKANRAYNPASASDSMPDMFQGEMESAPGTLKEEDPIATTDGTADLESKETSKSSSSFVGKLKDTFTGQ